MGIRSDEGGTRISMNLASPHAGHFDILFTSTITKDARWGRVHHIHQAGQILPGFRLMGRPEVPHASVVRLQEARWLPTMDGMVAHIRLYVKGNRPQGDFYDDTL